MQSTRNFLKQKFKLTELYKRCRAYNDRKAGAEPLALFSYCLLLKPKLMTQSEFASKPVPICCLSIALRKF